MRSEVRTLPSPALIFLHRQIRPNRSIVLNFGIIPGSFGLFYTRRGSAGKIEKLGFLIFVNPKHA